MTSKEALQTIRNASLIILKFDTFNDYNQPKYIKTILSNFLKLDEMKTRKKKEERI